MNLKNIFLIILYFNKVSFSYIIPKRINNKPQLQSQKKNYIYPFNFTEEKNNNLIDKVINKIIYKKRNFAKLIRSDNILPTLLLNFSGGWIANPSVYNLFHSTPFIISMLTTILIMCSSMIINDILDINIDKINYPNKPLINGSISVKEAYSCLFILLSLTELLSLKYFPKKMQFIINLSILNIILYTPIFKKITFIKNISCAFLVSCSVIFSSLGSNINLTKNKELLSILYSTLYYGSFYNELLLDIIDKDGDKRNNIPTIPVIYGNTISINFLLIMTNIVLLVNTFFLQKLYNFKIALLFPIIFFQLLLNLINIKKNNYSKLLIINYVKNTNNSLFLLLFYMCSLATFTMKK
jgi:geranylgeranylglycerol-phosphate geranylgeranyltransferase